MRDNKILSLTVRNENKELLTIKDSIRIIPGGLGNIAKDFKIETQKDHFPHYFNPLELYNRLDWEGALPAYSYFEPKRTTQNDYDEMAEEFQDKPWNFLEVSKSYIKGDVISLHQILVQFFTELRSEFPINPLQNLSIPGIAFKIWKTKQLPLLLKDDLKVYDFSRSSDNMFRGAYLGGIVDVYRPHLIGVLKPEVVKSEPQANKDEDRLAKLEAELKELREFKTKIEQEQVEAKKNAEPKNTTGVNFAQTGVVAFDRVKCLP